MELKAVNYIGNKTSRKGNRFFNGFNPVENKKLEPAYADASPDEVKKAVEKADKAFLVFRIKAIKALYPFIYRG